MSRCCRCDGCRNQWAEAEGEFCPHCNYPGNDKRSLLARLDGERVWATVLLLLAVGTVWAFIYHKVWVLL